MLTTLSLRNNPFSDLGIIGQRLRALEVLDLSDTEVATSKNNEIQLVSFASLVNLTELYLVKVQAHYVENEEQTTLPKLKVLDLSGNLITPSNFNFRVFRSLPVLEELYLRNCMMGTLFVTDIRQDMPSLKRIFLDGNNFDCNLLQKLLAHLNDRGIVAPGQSNKCQIGYDNLQGLCCKSYDDYYPPVIPQSGPATSTTKESVGTTTSIMSTTSPDSIDEIETKGMDTDGESSTWIIILVVIALFCLAGLITAVVLFKMKVKRHQQVPTVDDVSHEL
uniref:Uncharacterized protein n=1 Tax=Anopheles epiroticus TaxID=199890 RepID=A0A182PSE7_9DIPT